LDARQSFGAEAGRDAGLGGTPPLSRHLVDARRRHLRHRPRPLVRPGALLTVLSLLAGVGRCPLANGRECLLGCPSARRNAGTIATVGPARGGRGAGSGPELPRVDRHQYRSLAKGLRARGAGPITGTSAGLECRVHQIASSVRLRWPGVTGGSGAVRIPLLRVGPAGANGPV
jgi:hypothetical protein